MLKFMRKYSQQIMLFIVIAFVGSIVIFGLSSSFFNLGRSSGPRQVKQESDFALLNGKPMDYLKFRQMLAQNLARFSGEQLDPAIVEYIKYNVFQDFVNKTLLLREAERRDVDVSGREVDKQIEKIMQAYNLKDKSELKDLLVQNKIDYDYFVQDIRESIMVSKLRSSILQNVKVTDRELNNHFKEVKARHILVQPTSNRKSLQLKERLDQSEQLRKKAEQILEKAKSGEDFAELARKYSDGPSASQGGQLGWFGVGQMVEPFQKAAFSLAPGEITGPVKTSFGYHIIKVEDTRYKERPEDKTDEEIKEEILGRKRQKALEAVINPLREQAELDIYSPDLLAYKNKTEGDYQKAIGQYRKLVAQNPGNPVPHIYIGQVYDATEQYDKAVQEYKKGLIKDELDESNQNPYLHFAMGSTYMKMDKNEKATEQFAKASELAGDNLYLRNQLAEKYKELGAEKAQRRETEEIQRIKKQLEAERAKQQEQMQSKEEAVE